VTEHADLESECADPVIHAAQDRARTTGRRYAKLGPIVTTYQEWLRVGDVLKRYENSPARMFRPESSGPA
jgi:peptide chain release factor 1